MTNLSHVHISGALLSESQCLKAEYAVYWRLSRENGTGAMFSILGDFLGHIYRVTPERVLLEGGYQRKV